MHPALPHTHTKLSTKNCNIHIVNNFKMIELLVHTYAPALNKLLNFLAPERQKRNRIYSNDLGRQKLLFGDPKYCFFHGYKEPQLRNKKCEIGLI